MSCFYLRAEWASDIRHRLFGRELDEIDHFHVERGSEI